MALFDFGNKKKFEELKKCLEEENYDVAIMVADQIPIHKVKNLSEMNMLGKAYKKHEDFFLAREFFERSYAQRVSRTVLVDLMDCCLELKDLESTERYFNEYQKLAPEDKITQYIYRYEIEKRKGRERKLLIMILEELKVLEYVEEYAYELALQYHKAGRKQDCINECNDIISWFGIGDSVERARILLAYYRGEISLEEVESEGAYYPKKSIVQEMKESEQEDVWLAKKAEKLREEVKKANYRDEVKKAEEAAKSREEARRAEEVKRMQEELNREEEIKRVREQKGEKEDHSKTEIRKVQDIIKLREEAKRLEEIRKEEEIKRAREEAKRLEEIRKEEEIKRAREELKRAEEAVSKAKQEAREIEEVIKMQEEISCSEIVEENITSVEEVVNEVEEIKENVSEVSLEVQSELVENSLEKSILEPFFELETKEIEISKEQHKELADLLERKQVSLSKVLKSFGRIDNVKQQVLHSMDILLETKENSFFVVMGKEKSGKTTLGLSFIKLLFELGLICYDRTAIIDAIQLNQISMKDYESQLKNCNMIIEHAGSITEQKMEELVDFFRINKNETCLFLEDSNVKMGELLTSQREWTTLFYNQILLQEYTTDDLMGFAYDYIKKEDYSIDSMAASVLHRKIDEIVKLHGKESSLSYVMQLVKEILNHAEQRVSNILLGMVSQGKIQIGEYLIILLEDIVQ